MRRYLSDLPSEGVLFEDRPEPLAGKLYCSTPKNSYIVPVALVAKGYVSAFVIDPQHRPTAALRNF